MSYILDALRKAQAERERGQVPGLEARSPVQAGPAATSGRNGGPLWAAGGLVALVLAGVGVWYFLQPAGGPALQQPAAVVMPAPPVAAAPAPAAAPVPVSVPVPAPAVAPPPPPMVVSAPPAAVAAVPASVPASTASVAAAPVRQVRLAQLPPELRRELPPLNVGGSMWSESAASRFVILDGQVLREGEQTAAGVVVERIAQKAAWLRWRDWRLELAF